MSFNISFDEAGFAELCKQIENLANIQKTLLAKVDELSKPKARAPRVKKAADATETAEKTEVAEGEKPAPKKRAPKAKKVAEPSDEAKAEPAEEVKADSADEAKGDTTDGEKPAPKKRAPKAKKVDPSVDVTASLVMSE
jgi:hypothetical protein